MTSPPSFLQKFLVAYAEFKAQIADMEKRLAQMVCQAFDDCAGCESAFKVSLPARHVHIHMVL